MDLARGKNALIASNHLNRFDYPGCAWPGPYDELSCLGKNCENGANAIAEEATT